MNAINEEIPEFAAKNYWQVFEPVDRDLAAYIRKDYRFRIQKYDSRRYKLVITRGSGDKHFDRIPLDLLAGDAIVDRVKLEKKKLPHWKKENASVFARALISKENALKERHYLCITVEYGKRDRVATVSLLTKAKYKRGYRLQSDGSAHGNNY